MELEKVDLRTKLTAGGLDFSTISPVDLSRFPKVQAFQKVVGARPAVQDAMRAEGLIQ